MRFAVGLAALFSSAAGVLLWVARRPLGQLFTEDSLVVASIDQNMLGVTISIIPYALFMTSYGACRGTNKQLWAFASCTSGYAIGLPLAYWMGVKWQWPRPLLGVWCGNAIAMAWAFSQSIGTFSFSPVSGLTRL